MGTRSNIGIVEPDGTVREVYCHWDGYLSYNGKILADYYTDVDKVKELINNGSISSLGVDIGTKHKFDEPKPSNDQGFHLYCTFYRRDRGNYGINTCITLHQDKEEYREDADGEFLYLFENDKWLVSIRGEPWIDLNDALL